MLFAGQLAQGSPEELDTAVPVEPDEELLAVEAELLGAAPLDEARLVPPPPPAPVPLEEGTSVQPSTPSGRTTNSERAKERAEENTTAPYGTRLKKGSSPHRRGPRRLSEPHVDTFCSRGAAHEAALGAGSWQTWTPKRSSARSASGDCP